ncbi:MAG: methionyl-tRNA formyltransferase, partial [Nitrospinota bacterium]
MVKNNPLRIVFFGTPEFALPALDRLYGDDRFIIESIVTQPDKPRGRGKILTQTAVNEFATSHYLPVLKPITLNQEILIKNIRDFHPDFIVVVAYG